MTTATIATLSTWTQDFNAWRERANANTARAKRIADAIRDRARALSAEAGLDPNLLGIHPHNAMVSYSAGHPWAGVDYAKVRRVLWLIDRAFEPTRVADRLNARLWNRMLAERHGCAAAIVPHVRTAA